MTGPNSLHLLDELIDAVRRELPWRAHGSHSLVGALGPFLRSIQDDDEQNFWTRVSECLEANATGSFDAAIEMQQVGLVDWAWGRGDSGEMWISRGEIRFSAEPMMTPHRGLALVCLQAIRHEKMRDVVGEPEQ